MWDISHLLPTHRTIIINWNQTTNHTHLLFTSSYIINLPLPHFFIVWPSNWVKNHSKVKVVVLCCFVLLQRWWWRRVLCVQWCFWHWFWSMWDLWLRLQLAWRRSCPPVLQPSLPAVHPHQLAVRSWSSRSHAYVVTSKTPPLSSMSTLLMPERSLVLVGFPYHVADQIYQQITQFSLYTLSFL